MSAVQGNREHGAVDRGSPIKTGGKAASSAPSDVDAGDRVDGYYDLKGRQFVRLDSASSGATTTETRSSTATLSNVNDAATSATLLASNTARLGARIVNDSTSILYAKYGTTATSTDYTHKLLAGETLFETQYTGRIDGIWSADASGAARVTELT